MRASDGVIDNVMLEATFNRVRLRDHASSRQSARDSVIVTVNARSQEPSSSAPRFAPVLCEDSPSLAGRAALNWHLSAPSLPEVITFPLPLYRGSGEMCALWVLGPRPPIPGIQTDQVTLFRDECAWA